MEDIYGYPMYGLIFIWWVDYFNFNDVFQLIIYINAICEKETSMEFWKGINKFSTRLLSPPGTDIKENGQI